MHVIPPNSGTLTQGTDIFGNGDNIATKRVADIPCVLPFHLTAYLLSHDSETPCSFASLCDELDSLLGSVAWLAWRYLLMSVLLIRVHCSSAALLPLVLYSLLRTARCVFRVSWHRCYAGCRVVVCAFHSRLTDPCFCFGSYAAAFACGFPAMFCASVWLQLHRS